MNPVSPVRPPKKGMANVPFEKMKIGKMDDVAGLVVFDATVAVDVEEEEELMFTATEGDDVFVR